MKGSDGVVNILQLNGPVKFEFNFINVIGNLNTVLVGLGFMTGKEREYVVIAITIIIIIIIFIGSFKKFDYKVFL